MKNEGRRGPDTVDKLNVVSSRPLQHVASKLREVTDSLFFGGVGSLSRFSSLQMGQWTRASLELL